MGEIPLREKFARIDAQVGRAGRIVQTILQLGHSTTTPEDRFSVLRAMNAAFGLVGHQYKLASIELQLDIALSRPGKAHMRRILDRQRIDQLVKPRDRLVEAQCLDILTHRRDGLVELSRECITIRDSAALRAIAAMSTK